MHWVDLYVSELERSIMKNDFKSFKMLLIRGDTFKDMMHLIIKQNANIDFIELVLSREPSLVDSIDNNGKTPLHYAADFSQIEILLKYDARYIQDNGGFTPLDRLQYMKEVFIKNHERETATLMKQNPFMKMKWIQPNKDEMDKKLEKIKKCEDLLFNAGCRYSVYKNLNLKEN